MPEVLQARNAAGVALVVRDLLKMQGAGQQEAVTAIIRMVQDLGAHGQRSRYARALKGTPIWELKTRSRGGAKGGTRVYFFWRADGVPVLCGAEIKTGDAADRHLLLEALRAYERYTEEGKP